MRSLQEKVSLATELSEINSLMFIIQYKSDQKFTIIFISHMLVNVRATECYKNAIIIN